MAAEVSGDSGTVSDTAAASTLERFETWMASTPDARGIALGGGYQAVTELFHSPIGDFVVKTARGPWPWSWLGRAAIRREHEVYRRINGIRGVARCFGVIDGRKLVLEHVRGDTFRRREAEITSWDDFFSDLLETIDAIHSVGVAHGDLKRKDNLIVGDDMRPYIVDFGVASIDEPNAGPWARFMFRWMWQYDYNAWVKLKYRRDVGDLNAADARLYRPTAAERVARVIRVVWQKLTLRRLRRRIWPRR